MSGPLEPATAEELAEAVRAAPRVIARGAGTKPNLGSADGAVPVSTRRLTGIVDYAPGEFTFTARAGTPVREVAALLAAQGQYLPFDPPLAAAGATLGGTVAAGLSGPGRFRFGGVRDFILAVRFVDGDGRILRQGGKVVKNAAGFDLPKFFVGSLGRFGILAEITFKVFPRPAASSTLAFVVADDRALAGLMGALAKGRWELDALEAPLGKGRLYARLAAPAEALAPLAAALMREYPAKLLDPDAARTFWQSVDAFGWAHPQGALCKVPLSLDRLPALLDGVRLLPDIRMWLGGAGSAAYLSLSPEADTHPLDAALRAGGFAGLAWRGPSPLWLGTRPSFAIHAAVKRALDSGGRFPDL